MGHVSSVTNVRVDFIGGEDVDIISFCVVMPRGLADRYYRFGEV
jgi:hypothetical protein